MKMKRKKTILNFAFTRLERRYEKGSASLVTNCQHMRECKLFAMLPMVYAPDMGAFSISRMQAAKLLRNWRKEEE